MQYLSAYIHNKLHSIYEENEIKSLFRRIMEFVCRVKPHEISLCKDKEISPNERQRIEDIVMRLQNHEPIQYILGETEFYGMTFIVNQNVLIPRPETEELVELIINMHTIHRKPDVVPREPCTILDIGTGSGCIAVSLAKYLPHARVYAIDHSEKALETAKRNALINKVEVQFIGQDLFEAFPPGIFPEKWDIIVSNPPYITTSEQKNMARHVLDYEPHNALFVPDREPLLFYKQIAGFGKKYSKETGEIYVETSALHGRDTEKMFRSEGYNYVELIKDISGKDRIVRAKMNE
ncbi:MAG: peptide chain release factor N(5)-glutamine methyltransferase [Dysgonamonadaceae bacterium]|jgi:release factor glutamine methyltransferase|nr:peptide chain release factor N(5)-glutamine methyltransferase [Dysgonamonadaceae bacterium]